MKYKELFEDIFIERLNQFFEKDVIVRDEEVNEYVDVEGMIKRAGYTVKYISCNDSFIANRTVFINPNMLLTRQRFILARTLGLLVNNNKEVIGNAFASQLLMPKALVVDNIRKVIESNNYDATKLTEVQVETLIDDVANRLQVSAGALEIRINHLAVLQEKVIE